MAEQIYSLPSFPTLWLPSNDFCIDMPNSTTLWYMHDRKQFINLGKQRLAYIRPALHEEFLNKQCNALAPTLWVLVLKIGEWHLRIPIWRGPQFFSTALLSDEAVILTAADCVSLGGHDPVAIKEWKARVFGDAPLAGD